MRQKKCSKIHKKISSVVIKTNANIITDGGFNEPSKPSYTNLLPISLLSTTIFLTLAACGSSVESSSTDTETETETQYSENNDSDSETVVVESNADDKNSIDNGHSIDDNSTTNIESSSEATKQLLEHSDVLLSSANTLVNIDENHLNFPVKKELLDNVSQQFLGVNDIEQRLMEALPEVAYHVEGLSPFAQQVNNANWQHGTKINSSTIIKIQALLDWNNHSVGAIDGKFSRNTIKALQTFQKARGLKPSSTMNSITWKLLTADNDLTSQPVFVKYTLTKKDVSIPNYASQYHSKKEAVAEKFHMSRAMLTKLNPQTQLQAGEVITVFNPAQPNLVAVNRVEVYKQKNLLVAFDESDKIVASYPTTVGYNSPSGSYSVANRVIKPYYNSDFKDKTSTKPPGPNNPVGLVWMGLSKPSFGIHGSPQPEMISRQRSHGCVRLTNWDALALYGTMKLKARVDFKNS